MIEWVELPGFPPPVLQPRPAVTAAAIRADRVGIGAALSREHALGAYGAWRLFLTSGKRQRDRNSGENRDQSGNALHQCAGPCSFNTAFILMDRVANCQFRDVAFVHANRFWPRSRPRRVGKSSRLESDRTAASP
jgi:hypothetical protein